VDCRDAAGFGIQNQQRHTVSDPYGQKEPWLLRDDCIGFATRFEPTRGMDNTCTVHLS
jgi:hypothetical protein